MFRRVKEFGARYVDYRMAWVSGGFMGLVVWLVNLSHGAGPAMIAATKQGVYTFLFAGLMMRTCERLAVMDRPRPVALGLSVLVPSAMAIGFTYIMHSLKGTPEPFLSTVPTILIAPPSFVWWGLRKRRLSRQGSG